MLQSVSKLVNHWVNHSVIQWIGESANRSFSLFYWASETAKGVCETVGQSISERQTVTDTYWVSQANSQLMSRTNKLVKRWLRPSVNQWVSLWSDPLEKNQSVIAISLSGTVYFSWATLTVRQLTIKKGLTSEASSLSLLWYYWNTHQSVDITEISQLK